MLAGPHPRSLGLAHARSAVAAGGADTAPALQSPAAQHSRMPESRVHDAELLAASRFQMRPIVATLAALLFIPALSAQDDRGVPSRDGLVVCVSASACDAGASVLARGGNAVDAAVATAFALAVTHPTAGNIGGGGFMIVRTASGDVATFDYREKAPLASTRTMYLDAEGKIDRSLTSTGYKAPGVPGTVRGLEL